MGIALEIHRSDISMDEIPNKHALDTNRESVAMLRKFTKHALLYTPDPVCIVNNFNFKNAQNAYGVL